jgi:hypothetical protein
MGKVPEIALYLSGSNTRMPSFEAGRCILCSRFKHCAVTANSGRTLRDMPAGPCVRTPDQFFGKSSNRHRCRVAASTPTNQTAQYVCGVSGGSRARLQRQLAARCRKASTNFSGRHLPIIRLNLVCSALVTENGLKCRQSRSSSRTFRSASMFLIGCCSTL